MVALQQVQGTEIARATQRVQGVIDAWEHVGAFVNGLPVQLPIIHAHPPSFILFLNKEDIRCVVAVGGTHDADLRQFLDLLLNFCVMSLR